MFVLGMCTYFGKYEGREIIPIASGIRCLSINLRRIDTSSENLNQSSNWINRISMKVSKVPQESSLWEACRFNRISTELSNCNKLEANRFWGDTFSEFSNIPLEHTPDPEPTVYEEIPFIWGFGEAWAMLQLYVGVLLDIYFSDPV